MTRLPEKELLAGTKTPATTTGEMKYALGRLRDYLADLFGDDSSDKEMARKTLGVDLSALALETETRSALAEKADRTEVAGALSAKADRDDLLELEAEIAQRGTPVGTIGFFAMAEPPPGYLKADGSEVGRETYPDLFSAIGTVFGAGDGETTFGLPDLVDRFVQGSDVPGEKINAGLPNIIGTTSDALRTTGNCTVGATGALSWDMNIGNYANGAANGFTGSAALRFDASRSNAIYGASDTVQPPALTLLPCIKAFDAATNPGLVDVTALAGEMNAKLGKTVDGKTVRYVTDSFSDGTLWYRKWSDGWLEQGGLATKSNAIVTLPVPFSSSDYTLSVTVCDERATAFTASVVTSAYAVTPVSFTLRIYYVATNYDASCRWYACGYGNES